MVLPQSLLPRLFAAAERSIFFFVTLVDGPGQQHASNSGSTAVNRHILVRTLGHGQCHVRQYGLEKQFDNLKQWIRSILIQEQRSDPNKTEFWICIKAEIWAHSRSMESWFM